MIFYKRFGIYYNDLQGKWIVLDGGFLAGSYNSLNGAKCAITWSLK